MAKNRQSQNSRKGKTIRGVINGPMETNGAILLALGQLFVNWSNNESVFLAVLQNLLGSQTHRQAAIVWFSHKNTRARLQLIEALARDAIADEELLSDILAASSKFYNLTKVRNFYAHATFQYSEDLQLVEAQSFEIIDDTDVVKTIAKALSPATMNEIMDVTWRLTESNGVVWDIARRIGEHTGSQRARIPPQFLQSATQGENHPHLGDGEAPPSQREPSRG